MTPTMIGLIGFAALIILMFLHVPVGFVMALVGYLGFGYIVSWSAASNLLIRDFYSTFSAYNLTVIPLFVLMGQVAFHSESAVVFSMQPINFSGICRAAWQSPPSAPVPVFPLSAAPPARPRQPWPPSLCRK